MKLWAYFKTTHTGADPGVDVGKSRNGMKWTQKWGHWPARAGARGLAIGLNNDVQLIDKIAFIVSYDVI